MSLCLINYLDNGNLLISGDSRACTYDDNGLEYVSNDATQKIYKLDEKTVVFVSGIATPLMQTIEELKTSSDKSPNSLAGILKRNIELIPENEIEESRKKLMTAIILATVENNEVIYYVVTDANNYKPIRVDEGNGARGAVGAYDETLLHFYYEGIAKCENTEDVKNAFINTYQKANSYQVGGIATIYELSPKGIVSEFKYQIKDVQKYRRFSEKYREACNLKGLNIINDKTGETTLSIDNDGSINMNGGNINWNNVNSDPTATNAQNKAKEAKSMAEDIVNGEFIGGTFIDGTTVKAPEIVGGVIKGGRIESDSTIDVRTDANIGRKLIINGDDFANGVEFHSKDGNKVAEIYIDPVSGSMFIETVKGKIMLNGEEYSSIAKLA